MKIKKTKHLEKRTAADGREELRLSVPITRMNVNREEGILRDVVLIEAGREATGHGIYIDERTLETALAAVAAVGGQLKAYINHPTFMEWINDEDRLMAMPGWFSEVKRDGEKLVAGEMHFYDSFREEDEKSYNRLLEMAEKTPKLFGMSIEAWGYLVFVAEDGTEYSERPEDIDLKHEGMPAFRIVELDAAAFVSQPAATSGLFASTFGRLLGRPGKADVEELARAVAAWQSARQTKENFEGGGANGPGRSNANHDQDEATTMNIIKALKGKYKDDEARLQRALLIVANSDNPAELTVEAVEKQLGAADQNDGGGATGKLIAQLREKYKADTARLSRAMLRVAAAEDPAKLSAMEIENELLREDNEQLKNASGDSEKLKQERDDAEARFRQIKQSGHLGDVPSGTPVVLNGQHYQGYTAQALGKLKAEGGMGAKFAITSIDDLWIPEVWIPGAAEQVPIATDFFASGAVVTNPVLARAAAEGGSTINVPNFREPDNADEPQVEGTGPSLHGVESGLQIAARLNRVNTLGASALAAGLSGSDPIGYALGAIGRLRNRNRLITLIATLRGLFGTTGAAAYAGLRNDAFVEDPGATPDEANLFDEDKFNLAVGKLLENANMLQNGAILAHPDIVTAMRLQDSIEYIRSSQGEFRVRVYNEVPIFESKLLVRDGTTNGQVYDTYILAPGSIGMGYKPQGNRVGDIASMVMKEDEHLNEQTIYDRTSGFIHPAWAQWDGTPSNAKGGPSNAELAAEGNWNLGAEHLENVGITQIKTNG